MSNNASGRTFARALLLALLGTQSCYSVRSAPVLPVPIRLASPYGFLIHELRAGGVAQTEPCFVLEARGELGRVDGDTLVFQRVSRIRQPQGDAVCRLEGVAYVVTSRHPDMRAKRAQFDPGLTIVAAPVFILGALFAVLALLFAATGGA